MVADYHANARQRQQGTALLTFMLVVFLVATTFFLSRSNGAGARNRSDALTANAMAQAKEALIGRAAANENLPGSLSCPDIDNNGVSDGNFGNCVSLLGRLPWKTLDVPELLDGNGERLWYALPFKLRDHVSSRPINPQQALQLTLDGTTNIAAIIFSPGAPLAGQTGRPSNTVADYLDGANSDGDQSYISGPQSSTFNDKALAISRDDIFRAVNQRVLGEIRGPDDHTTEVPKYGLRHYYAVNGAFPWADSDSDGVGDIDAATGALPYIELTLEATAYAWLNANQWLPLVTYQRLNTGSVRISIGTSHMDVAPCTRSPCP